MLWTTSAYFHTTYEKLAGYGECTHFIGRKLF